MYPSCEAISELEPALLDIVQGFEANPFLAARSLRQLRENEPDSFPMAALRTLAKIDDCPGARHLAKALKDAEGPPLEDLIRQDTLTTAEAVRLVLTLRRSDPQTEVRLARMLLPDAPPLTPAVLEQILDVIHAVADSPKLVPVLTHVFKSASERVRARLSMTIGRHHRNREWVEERMADPNPRVRANMVEVYWGDKSREALGVFRRGCHDMHPRVVANAALGLYQAGLIESLSILGTELAGHPESGFRSSAAWAIGCTRDPRFHDLLAKLTRDPDANVRLHAFQSLGEIKRESDRQQSLRHARLHFIKLHRTSDTAPSGGQPRSGLHIFFRVEDEESGAPIPKIRPLEISVAENNEPVLDYRFQERVKYPRPGVYDIHFHSEPLSLNPLPKMLEVSLAIRTETHSGQHSS